MAKAFMLLAMILFCSLNLPGSIVINEMYCPAAGNETNGAWLELYNSGPADVELTDAQIQVAGSSFATVFTFPHYILRSGHIVLLGEANVTQAVFIANLDLANSNTTTAGLRYVSPDGTYTDTVLYGSTNTHHLPDDTGLAGNSFAPVTPTGYSLARKADGYDTNQCGADFYTESVPTPGLANHIYRDYGLANSALTVDNGSVRFETDIYNYAVANEDTVTIQLVLDLDSTVLHRLDIQPVAAGHFVHLSLPLAIPDQDTGLFRANLLLERDAALSNNTWSINIGHNEPSVPRLNELLYNPATGNQEWVELEIPSAFAAAAELVLEDLAGNRAHFQLPAACPRYLVLCENAALMESRYPDCPSENILQITALPALNNEGDVLMLKSPDGITLDSLNYFGNANYKDVSLERYVDADSTVSWHYCYAAAKGTPGQPNSTPPPPSSLHTGQVKVVGSPFNPKAGEKMHLQYNFSGANNSISCSVFNLSGVKLHSIASGYGAKQSGEIVWDGCDKHGKALPRGIYIMLVEARNSSGKYILRKQLTVVLATK